jgi:threonine dehydrogenase-like Zn-dependent dehydrogenase
VNAIQTTALLLERDLSMRVGSRLLPAPGADEAVVRVRWAGLCGSDLHVMRTGDWVREWPATLGHEIYGTIETAPGDSGLLPGQGVVADSRVACGRCMYCAAGEPDLCAGVEFVGEARPGGFAELCVLPTAMLHPVPPELEGATASLSEPLAVVLHGISKLRSKPRNVLVIGHGPIGSLAGIELRRQFGELTIDVAEPTPLRAQLARALGSRTADYAGALGRGAYDTVVDAAGYRGSLTDALLACAPRGQVLLLSLAHAEVTIKPAELVERGVAVIGCNAFVGELSDAIALLAAERWRYEPVITDAIALEELPDMARAQLERPDAIKVVVRP